MFKVAKVLSFFIFLCCLASCTNAAGVVISGDNEQVLGSLYKYFEYENMADMMNENDSINDKEKYLSRKILEDGKTVADDVKDSLLETCKCFIAVEKLFKKQKLSFTEQENKDIESKTSEFLENNKEFMQRIDVKKEDIKKIMSFLAKQEKIFESFYENELNKGDEKDEVLKLYKEKNAKFSYISKSIEKENQIKLDENEIEKVKKDFELYARQIENKTKTIKSIYEDIRKSGDDCDFYDEDDVVPIENNFPDELAEPLRKLENGKTAVVESDGCKCIFLFVGKDMSLDFDKKTNDEKKETLLSLKRDDFEEYVKKEINETNFTVNDEKIEEIGCSYMFDEFIKFKESKK